MRGLLILGLAVSSGAWAAVSVAPPPQDRDLARDMPSHAVGDREQVRARVRRVLVPFTEEADVGTYRVAEYKCHLRSSRTVLPMRIGTPVGTGIGRVTFCRSR